LDGSWTPGRVRSFITAVLRSGSRRWPPRYETLNEAKTEKKVNVDSGRVAQHFRCASCGLDYPSKQVQIDHRDPVVDPLVGFISLLNKKRCCWNRTNYCRHCLLSVPVGVTSSKQLLYTIVRRLSSLEGLNYVV